MNILCQQPVKKSVNFQENMVATGINAAMLLEIHVQCNYTYSGSCFHPYTLYEFILQHQFGAWHVIALDVEQLQLSEECYFH